ncbi:membrane protein insertion efficiency factor YidD [bacterium]|jgi:uncharacterized protein|nr:membrane protein insertion efficiency factor YidD [bacterium]
MKTLVILLIKGYQQGISPFFPARCRFYPSCSEYMLQSVKKHSVLVGAWYGLKRLSKCHPFYNGGVDEENN